MRLDVRLVWPAFPEAAIPAHRPFLDAEGIPYGLRWWDVDHGAGRRQDGRMADANLALLPAQWDAGAGKSADREQHLPAAVLPASACQAVHGIVDVAGSAWGSEVAQCRPDEVQSGE